VKIGIFSDTHDHLDHIQVAVERFTTLDCGLVCHGGDFVSPFTLKHLRNLKCKVVAVLGDNDGNALGLNAGFMILGRISNPPHAFTAGGLKCLLMHRPDGLESFVKSQDYDLVIYGHTHMAEVRVQGKTTVINPGEGSGWTSGRASAAWFDTETREAEVFALSPPKR